MRLLQVITDTDRRGAQIFAADLGTALAGLGVDVTTVALRPGSGTGRLPFTSLGVHGRSPSALLRLRHEMTAADVTIAHGSATLAACAFAAVGTRQRWIYRQISDQLFWAGTPVRRFRVSRFLRCADAVTALSTVAKSVLVDHFAVPPACVTVVPNGVASSRFSVATGATRALARTSLDLATDAFVALYVGALVDEKGVDVAIDAVLGVAGTTLLIAGDGPRRDILELRARRGAGGVERVRFLGSVADVLPLYHAADVVVFPSIGGDSMPAALIESGMCGLVAICTPVGSATDVVVDGETGTVVAAGDVGELAAALRAMRDDPAERARRGAAAHDLCCSTFDIDTVAMQWLQVLRRVVAG